MCSRLRPVQVWRSLLPQGLQHGCSCHARELTIGTSWPHSSPFPQQNFGNNPDYMGDATTGVSSSFYSFLLGLLLSQWAMVRWGC